MAKKEDPLHYYVIVHHQRFGDTATIVLSSRKVTNSMARRYLGDDFEQGREDEWVEVYGPQTADRIDII